MKRINLVTPKKYFPLPFILQRRIVFLLFLFLFLYDAYHYYRVYNSLKKEQAQLNILENRISLLKQSIKNKQVISEKAQLIEKEFANIATDYNILKKNMIAKDILIKLSELVPNNTWLTSIDFKYEDEKMLFINGKTLEKEEIFTFLNNLSSIGRNQELIEMSSDGGNKKYNFQITLQSI